MAGGDLGTARGTVIIDGDTSGLDGTSEEIDKFGKKAAKTGDDTSAALRKVSNTSAVAGGAIVAGFALAVKTASDFQKELSGIQAVSGATADQMDLINKAALRIGKDTAFSASEAAQAMSELAKAGVSIPDILNGAADATVALAAAGGVDLPEAATIASNAMNQFKLSASDLPHVADLIAGAANASAIDVSQFGYSLSQVGAVAKLAGASFGDTATAIALMGNAGIVGSDAGTSLKSMLQRLNPQTKEAADLMKKLGIVTEDGTNRFYDQNGSLRSLADVSQVLQDSLAGMTDQQKQATLTVLFGQDAIRGAAILSEQGAAGFDKMAASMGKVSAADVAKTRMDNLAGATEQLKGSIETLQIGIGEAFIPVLQNMVNWINDVVGAILELPSWFVTTASVVGLAGGALLLFLGIAGRVVGGIAELNTAFMILTGTTRIFSKEGAIATSVTKLLTAAQAALNFVLKENPWIAIVSIILGVIAAVLSMTDSWKDLKKVFAPVADAFGKALTQIAKALQPLMTMFANLYKSLAKQIAPVFKELADALLPPIMALFKALSPILQIIVELLADVLAPALALLAPLFQVIGDIIVVLMKILEPFIDLLSAILTPILNGVAWVLQIVADAIEWFGNQVGKWFGSEMPKVMQAFGKVWDNLYNNYIKPFWDNLMKLIQPIVDWFTNTVVPAMKKGIEILRDAWDADTKAMGVVWQNLQKALKPIVDWYTDNFITPLKNGGQDIKNGMVDYAKGSADAWNGFVTAIKPVVDWYVNSFINPIINAGKAVEDFIGTFVKKFDDIKTGVENALQPAGKAWDDFKGKIQDAKDRIEQAIQPLVDRFDNMRDRISGAIQTMQDRIQPIVDKFRGMWEDLQAKLGPIIDKLKDLFDKIGDAIRKALGDDGDPAAGAGGGGSGGGPKKSRSEIILDLLGRLLDFFVSGGGNLLIGALEVFAGALEIAANAIIVMAKALQWAWDNVLNPIITVFAAVITWLWQNIVIPATTGIATAFKWMSDQIQKVVGPVVQWVKDQMGSWAEIENTVSTIFTNVVNFIKDPFGGIRQFFEQKKDEIKGVFSDAKSWLVQAGKDIITGLINGLDMMTGGLVSKLGHITGLIPKNKGPEAVDKVLLQPNGEMIMKGLLNGMQSQVGSMFGFLNGLTSSIPAALQADINSQVFGANASGNSRTIIYNAAPGSGQIDGEQDLFSSMRRAKVVVPGW